METKARRYSNISFYMVGQYIITPKPLRDNYEIFFFFPFYHIGGAEKVHTLISAKTKGRKAIIFFTRKSDNDFFLQEFRYSGHK